MRAFIIAIAIVFVIASIPGYAGAEEKIANPSEFDEVSDTGIYNDNDYYVGYAPGIQLVDGGWGQVELPAFSIVELTYHVYLTTNDDSYEIRIGSKHMDDVRIGFNIEDAVNLHSWVSEKWQEELYEWESYVTENTVGEWNKITIRFEYTNNRVDGVRKKCEVLLNSYMLHSVELQTAEGFEMDIPEREWHCITFMAGDNSVVVIDDIRIHSEVGDTPGYNYSVLVLATGIIILIAVSVLSSGDQRARKKGGGIS